MDNASHGIDLVRFLLGDIVAVGAFVDTLAAAYQVEDTATSILRLASGAQVVITSYWSTGDPDGERNSTLEILGTEGAIISAPLHDKFSRGRLTIATAAGEEHHTFEESTHVALLEEFAAALAAGRAPAITIDDGLASLRTVRAVYAASDTGTIVRLAAN
jgi:predicted dehydrogenase